MVDAYDNRRKPYFFVDKVKAGFKKGGGGGNACSFLLICDRFSLSDRLLEGQVRSGRDLPFYFLLKRRRNPSFSIGGSDDPGLTLPRLPRHTRPPRFLGQPNVPTAPAALSVEGAGTGGRFSGIWATATFAEPPREGAFFVVVSTTFRWWAMPEWMLWGTFKKA